MWVVNSTPRTLVRFKIRRKYKAEKNTAFSSVVSWLPGNIKIMSKLCEHLYSQGSNIGTALREKLLKLLTYSCFLTDKKESWWIKITMQSTLRFCQNSLLPIITAAL